MLRFVDNWKHRLGHYANQLLVRVRFSFQKHLQTLSTCRSNEKVLFGKRVTDHDKSLFDLFLPGMNVKENVFFLQSASLKRHRVKHWCEQRGMNSHHQWQIVVKFNIPLFNRYFYNHLSNYTKTIIRLRLENIGEYSPRLRLGEYSLIFTSPSANNCSIIQIYFQI